MYIENPVNCWKLLAHNGEDNQQRSFQKWKNVQRLTADHGVGSSDPKCRGSYQKDRDIVYSLSKDEAVSMSSSTNGVELTTLRE